MSRGLSLILSLVCAGAGFATAYVWVLPQLWISHALWGLAGVLFLSALLRKDPDDPKRVRGQ